LANWRSGARAIECCFPRHPARQKRCSSDRTAARMWSSALGNRQFTIGSAAVEGNHWVIVDMVGKGGRLRTVPVPTWCKGLIDVWIHDTGVTEGKLFRRFSKNGTRQDEGVTTDVVWYAVKRYAKRIGIAIWHPTIFVALAPASATRPEANSNRFSSSLVTRRCKHGTVHRMPAELKRSGQ
jgi:integrase